MITSVCAQLLGDYDKVKAVSEGSDCRCKCLVRPLGRGACQRINEGSFKAEDFYTVETITSGPSCKCACVAPPSALNPCEGDFRLKKLREAESGDLKVGVQFAFRVFSCCDGPFCEQGHAAESLLSCSLISAGGAGLQCTDPNGKVAFSNKVILVQAWP